MRIDRIGFGTLCMTVVMICSAPEAAEPPLVPRITSTVTLDGRLDEPAWQKALRISDSEFSRWVADEYRLDPDEFVLRLFHDGRSLHVSLASYDGHVMADRKPENSDGLYSFSVINGKGAPQHYRLRWSATPAVASGQMLEHAKWIARLRGPFSDPDRRGAGYIFEFSIPLQALDWKPGQVVHTNIIVQDRDGKPDVEYSSRGAEFARFAFGSFDNDDLTRYRALRLAP